MLRRLFAGVLAAGLLLLIGAPAYAQPPVTTTTHQKNLVETFVDVVPTPPARRRDRSTPSPPPATLVEHSTVFDDGRVHATFTQTGTFVAVPLEDPSLPSFTGKFTKWGGFNQTARP